MGEVCGYCLNLLTECDGEVGCFDVDCIQAYNEEMGEMHAGVTESEERAES